MKQVVYLIILGACVVIAACSNDANTVAPSPSSDSAPKNSENSASGQVDSTTQLESNTVASASSDPVSNSVSGASSRDTGSSLTASVSDLSGLVTDLNGQVTATEIIVELPADILFDFDEIDIKQEAVPTLDKLARLISETNSNQVVVNGHTDSKGDDDYNMRLSQNRAESVKTWLVESGIEANRLQTVGYGETQPVADNETLSGGDDPQGRAANRRVEVVIQK